MTSRKWSIGALARDVRESGVWFVFLVLAILGIAVGVLDLINWDREFAKSILAEANAVVIDIFLLGIVIAIYEYHRHHKQEVTDLERELAHLRVFDAPEGILRKVELISSLIRKGQKPTNLRHYNLRGAVLSGCDLSGIDMRFTVLAGALMPAAQFCRSDLFCVDFSNSLLVQADLTGANLSEANFVGAQLSNAILAGADVSNADFRGALELRSDQLRSAKNWVEAYRDSALACGAPIPQFEKKPLGERIREVYRKHGNPLYPYSLVTFIHPDGREETRLEREDEEK